MDAYKIALVISVSDIAALESAANSRLLEQGKTPVEVSEILYDDGVFSIIDSLTLLYTPSVLYSGTSLGGVETFKNGISMSLLHGDQ